MTVFPILNCLTSLNVGSDASITSFHAHISNLMEMKLCHSSNVYPSETKEAMKPVIMSNITGS